MNLQIISTFAQRNGVVLEWLKRLIWKVSKRQKRFGGSNPPHSARSPKGMRTPGFVIDAVAFVERIPLTPQNKRLIFKQLQARMSVAFLSVGRKKIYGKLWKGMKFYVIYSNITEIVSAMFQTSQNKIEAEVAGTRKKL